jgi:hypothetical protein
METASEYLSAIPVHRLVPRRLHLGPFGSGSDLVKFLGLAMVGAAVAATTSLLLWLPFLGVGLLVALVRVEGRSLDDYALGYCRYRWRTASSPAPGTVRRAAPTGSQRAASVTGIRAGGTPIAYLPPGDLQRLFEEWRSALNALDRPVGGCMRGEPFSPLPFLPPSGVGPVEERAALDAYRELVRLLLRHRYRRVVELSVAPSATDSEPESAGLRVQLDGLLSMLERVGISAEGAVVDAPPGAHPRERRP